MNSVILKGRLTKDPDVRYTQGQEQMAIARYTLAVNRRGKDAGADFINCVCFSKSAEFAEKYLKKGQEVLIQGRINVGSYVNKEGQKVYATDVIVEAQEFCGTKSDAPQAQPQKTPEGGYMVIPEGIEESMDLPFK